jgi:neuroligin
LSDFHYIAPHDKIAKLLVERNVSVFLYVLNTTIEALDLPFWRRVPHDIEHLLLSGAPFMDIGELINEIKKAFIKKYLLSYFI